MHSNVQGFIAFMEAPPFPLLWFACGVYSSSRWHHCPGWSSMENTVWKYCTEFIKCMPAARHSMLLLIPCCYIYAIAVVPDLASLACGYKFALTDIRICEHDVVCLLAEAEHGYASMPPFISSRERENLKRKSKSKKNTSSRYLYCNVPFECSTVRPFI